MNNYYQIITYIKSILDCFSIPCTMNPIYEGYQLRFPWCEGDVAIHDGTYGSKAGHVETYEFPWDEGDVSELEPIEAAALILAYYEEVKKEE